MSLPSPPSPDPSVTPTSAASAAASPRAKAALQAAQSLCETRGVRLTAQRARALAALADADKPVKAYDLLPALGDADAPAKPATAYRALEFLEDIGLVHRIEALNAYVLCAHGGGSHITRLFICDRCGATQESAGGPVPREAAPEGFAIARSVIEHYGLCQACAAA